VSSLVNEHPINLKPPDVIGEKRFDIAFAPVYALRQG
jgi:hypothetical protein